MKKLIKITSGVAIMFMLVFTLSSFSSNTEVEADNNGVDVEIVKDGMRWAVLTNCGIIYATSSTDQFKNGELHMSTYIFDIPAECGEAPKKTVRVDLYEGVRYLFNPSGKLILKEIHN